MAKKKLIRFAQMKEFNNVIEPELDEVLEKDHILKGKWKSDFFKNNNPIVLELGCGKGEYTVGQAKMHPEKNYIGVDIKGARIWYGANEALAKEIINVGFLRTRIDFINRFFAENEIDEIWITFPDPQPQKNRARKRLTSTMFIDRYRKLLKKSGFVNLKTDSDFFYDFTIEQIEEHGYNVINRSDNLYQSINEYSEEMQKVLSFETHYESLFKAKGHIIKYVSFTI